MHRHVWKVESKVTQQSPWEMMNRDGMVSELSVKRGARLFVQPVIVTYRCGCGAQKVERV